MQPFASFTIKAADIAAMGAAAGNWVDSRGKLTPSNNRVVDTYNFETCQAVKIYISYIAMTGGTGGRLDLVECWPSATKPPGVDTAVAAAGRGGVQIITLTTDMPLPPAATNMVCNIDQYGAWRSSAGNFTNIVYRGGSIGLQLFYATIPGTPQDIYVDIWGIKDATFPRH